MNNKKGKGVILIGITLAAAIMFALIFTAINPVPVSASPGGSSLRIYGTFDEGPGNLTVTDPETGLRPENPPYTDPVGPFHPQNEQAPRKDFVTFNPAIMDHNQGYPELDFVECGVHSVQRPQEKVFKRMWYEKEWFKDHDRDGCWDVVIDKYNPLTRKYEYDRTMCLKDWNAIPEWKKEKAGLRIREWNNDPTINDSNVDIYGPAIKQEFAYMFLDDERMPIMIGNGSDILIPMAHDPSNPYRGLNSFDADGDGVRDTVRVESEATLGFDIDHDGKMEPMDSDATELSGDETVVLVLGDKYLTQNDTIQFFDHVVKLKDVFGLPGGQAIFDVCDNEGGGSQRCTKNVPLTPGQIAFFYRAKTGGTAERETFYLRLLSADATSKRAIVEVGRMFGKTYANIGANPYWSQKAFIVDEVFYNVVAIKAQDNCIKYIVFREKLPKQPIKLYGKHLKVWGARDTLPEMPPFNMNHDVIVDVQDSWTMPHSQQDKIGPKEKRPPLEICYVKEGEEERFKGELKEIYNETYLRPVQGKNIKAFCGEQEKEEEEHLKEFWNVEWFHTQPKQYTEFRLPADDKYLVTLSWIANESEITLWDSDPDGPAATYTGERFKFWYEDCSGPLYINASQSSIRLYGTFDEGPGDLTVTDPKTELRPENPPYTDPVGPFHPQHPQAPRKDFMTFNPAIMDHNQGYAELDFVKCDGANSVQRPQEKVFKRMWYEKEWFKDHDRDGCWDVVIDKYNPLTRKYEYDRTMCLKDWNAIPEWKKEKAGLRIREWNNDPTINDSNVDIYGPAIKQEFAYMFLDDERMPIMIGNGSDILIPMAHDPSNPYRGLNSFDADGDGVRDAVRVESEATLGLDIDHDGKKEPMDSGGIGLSGDETVVLVLGDKYIKQGGKIQFFDHVVTLKDVQVLDALGWAIFDVCDNEGGGSQRCKENVMLRLGQVAYFYRAKPGSPAERETFYLRLLSADALSKAAVIEVGRMFGQTYANIGTNPYWSQKAFIVDEVFYNVVAIKAQDNCIKYIVFREKLPKMPIKLFGKHLKVWAPGETLPEMSPFNMNHEVMVDVHDVQDFWTIPYSQQDKIGTKQERGALNITYVEEGEEERFKGELKEIYNETYLVDGENIKAFCGKPTPTETPPQKKHLKEFWMLEWFHTQPQQYTAFVMPEDQLYLMTLAWYAPESCITIWNHEPAIPAAYYTGERVKFWYDPANNTDIYVNRV